MANQNQSFVELRAKPVWSFEDFLFMLGLPESTAELVLNDTPAKFFTMGRRRFILQKDALDWLELIAESNPYKKRRNASKG